MNSKLIFDLYHLDVAKIHWGAAFRRLPAIVVLLLLGVLCHQPAAGVLAASSALSAGFGGLRQLRGSRLLAMVGTVMIMSFSAAVGTLTGQFHLIVMVAAGMWGFACGLLTVLAEDVGWMAMQGVIALLVASAFPSHGVEALGRAFFVGVGGLTQIGLLLLIWQKQRISRFGSEFSLPAVSKPTVEPIGDLGKLFRQVLVVSSPAFHYAVRVASTMMMAVELDHLLGLKNGYWLPMTTLVVLKPDFYRTYAGGVQRVTGTLIGVSAATVIALLIHPHHLMLLFLVGIFGLLTYAFQVANAVIFSTALTSFVVFLIAVTGLPEVDVTWHRLINTALGCALAMISRRIGLKMLRSLWGHALHQAKA